MRGYLSHMFLLKIGVCCANVHKKHDYLIWFIRIAKFFEISVAINLCY